MSNGLKQRGYQHDLTPDEVWRVFDALPSQIKRAIEAAPYKISPVAIRDLLTQADGDIDHVISLIHRRMAELTPNMAGKAYGRKHPQARTCP